MAAQSRLVAKEWPQLTIKLLMTAWMALGNGIIELQYTAILVAAWVAV